MRRIFWIFLVLASSAFAQHGVLCSGGYCGFVSGPTILYQQGIVCPTWWRVDVSNYVPANATEIHIKAVPITANADQWGNVDAVVLFRLAGYEGQYTEVIAAGQGFAPYANRAVDRSELIIVPGNSFDWCFSGNTLSSGANLTLKLIGYRMQNIAP